MYIRLIQYIGSVQSETASHQNRERETPECSGELQNSVSFFPFVSSHSTGGRDLWMSRGEGNMGGGEVQQLEHDPLFSQLRFTVTTYKFYCFMKD